MKVAIRSVISNIISGEWGEESINNDGVKVIRSTNFTNFGFLNLNNVTVRSISPEKIKNKKLEVGDIIIEKSGGSPSQPVGRVIIFEESGLFLTNNFTAILRPNISKIFPKYLLFCLLDLYNKGATIKYQNYTTGLINLKLNYYLEEEIYLPPYRDQIRISNLLEKVELVIVKRKEGIQLLNELVEAIFFKMFGDPIIGNQFTRKKFLEISKVRQGLQIPISKRFKESGLNRHLYITNQFLNGDKIAEYIENPSLSVVCNKNDILMTRTGNTGKVITDVEGVFHNNFFLIDFERKLLTKNYLFQYLKFPSVSNLILKLASTTTIPDLKHSDFYGLDIPVPPILLQNEFNLYANKIHKIIQEQNFHLKDMEEFYSSMTQQVFDDNVNLNRISFDQDLLPKIQDNSKLSLKSEKVLTSYIIAEKLFEQSDLTWETLSFERLSAIIRANFENHYFNFSMLLSYLEEDLKIKVIYHSTTDKKKTPTLEGEDDLHSFIAGAIKQKHKFLHLEQVFYNAEVRNIANISFTEKDTKKNNQIEIKNQSGIYFRIENEIIKN